MLGVPPFIPGDRAETCGRPRRTRNIQMDILQIPVQTPTGKDEAAQRTQPDLSRVG